MSGEGNSKMTAPRVEAALEALRHGCTRRAAAGAAGVIASTFYRWMDDDATFRDEVEKAELQAEAAFTMAVAVAVPKNWQAAAWWLERRKHTEYGRKDAVEMKIDLRTEARQLAQDLGLSEDEVFAELNSVLAGKR